MAATRRAPSNAVGALTSIGVALGIAIAIAISDVVLGVIAGASFIAVTVGLIRLWVGPNKQDTANERPAERIRTQSGSRK